MEEEKLIKLVKKLIQCPNVKYFYDKQASYYLEYIWDDWDLYMFNIHQEFLFDYLKWKVNIEKDKKFHWEIINLILDN